MPHRGPVGRRRLGDPAADRLRRQLRGAVHPGPRSPGPATLPAVRARPGRAGPAGRGRHRHHW